jgi:hypothetical protein
MLQERRTQSLEYLGGSPLPVLFEAVEESHCREYFELYAIFILLRTL